MSPSPPNVTVLAALQLAYQNCALQLASITGAPKPTYSIDGETVSWTEYKAQLVKDLKDLNEQIQIAGGVFELQTVMLPAGNANAGGGFGGGIWP